MAELPHFESSGHPTTDSSSGPWYSGMTRYHWFVLTVAALGWLFDCLDQQLFNLARKPAMETLLATGGAAASSKDVDFYAGLSTCVFLAGWATGCRCGRAAAHRQHAGHSQLCQWCPR